MPGRTAITTLPGWLLAAAGLVAAQTSTPAEQLYVSSGLQAQLAHLAEIFTAGFRESAPQQGVPERLLQSIESLAASAYSAEYFRQVIVPAIEAELTEEEIRSLLAWLDTPTARSLTELEERMATLASRQAKERYRASLGQSPPSQRRLELVAALDAAAGITEAATDSAINTSAAISIAIAAASAYPSYEELMVVKERLAEHRDELEEEIRELVLLDLLYTYLEVSDEMLEQYCEFAESPLGRHYHEVLNRALDEAYTRASWRLGQSIATLLALPQSLET